MGKILRYKDLPDTFGMGQPPFLWCPECGEEYSAHKGDYWNVPGEWPVQCGACKARMRLVTRTIRVHPWHPAKVTG